MDILKILSLYSVFIPLVVGAIRFKHIEANAKLVLLALAFASIAHIATMIYPPTELPAIFYNGYIIVDAIIWPFVFSTSITSVKIKRVLYVLMTISISLILITFLLSASFKKFHYQLVCANSLFQTLYIAVYFFEINSKNEYIRLKSKPIFWFCIGLLFYSACTFFIFLFYKKINSYYGKSHLNFLWGIHHFFNTFMYLLFAIGFVINKERHGKK
jgi:hypothetical protein